MPESDSQPIFYFDLVSPYAYLAAERVNSVLPRTPIWQPIHLGSLKKVTGRGSWARSDEERKNNKAEVERRAAERGLMPLRWPEQWPADTRPAMLAAAYAAGIGKGQAFALAAFRQSFAAGKDLSDLNAIKIAAAACEISPKAIEKALSSNNIRETLDRATTEARLAGVIGVPSFQIGDRVFWGDDSLEDAAELAL